MTKRRQSEPNSAFMNDCKYCLCDDTGTTAYCTLMHCLHNFCGII